MKIMAVDRDGDTFVAEISCIFLCRDFNRNRYRVKGVDHGLLVETTGGDTGVIVGLPEFRCVEVMKILLSTGYYDFTEKVNGGVMYWGGSSYDEDDE